MPSGSFLPGQTLLQGHVDVQLALSEVHRDLLDSQEGLFSRSSPE